MKLQGIAAASGIAIGTVLRLEKDEIMINPMARCSSPEKEISKLSDAIAQAKEQIEYIANKSLMHGNEGDADIFSAQLLMLEDEEFLEPIREQIRNDHYPADYSVMLAVEQQKKIFEALDDAYFRERIADIQDIGRRLVENLHGVHPVDFSNFGSNTVLVAEELTPSETAQIDREKVIGFCVDFGGKTSHAAIIAGNLGIPAVVGLGTISTSAKTGDTIIVDGSTGIVILNPGDDEMTDYIARRDEYRAFSCSLRTLIPLPAITADGSRKVYLAANITTPDDLKEAHEQRADGIGLYRTEFLYMGRKNFPTEEEQFSAYRQAAETMAPNPVIIRTMDIGGDKELSYLAVPKEDNPFMGWRAIRICLDRPEILLTQLRAILRASAYGKVRIMYPMISNVGEIRSANAILEQAKEQLRADKIPFDEEIRVGIMIEVPAAAVNAAFLIRELDFFSIGTNDLIQYTLAADRMNHKVADLYNPLDPAVLQLIAYVIRVAHGAGKWVGMCGAMAGNKELTPLLLGMGLDEFSMGAGSLQRVKHAVRSVDYLAAQRLAADVLQCGDSAEIQKLLHAFNERGRKDGAT